MRFTVIKGFFITAMVVSLIIIGAGRAAADKAGADYHPRPAAMTDVEAVLERARAENKLAFIALGANWCHDSRGLATKLKNPEIASVISQSYVPILINVGYYDAEGIVIAKHFGRGTIYSTPTVLIIDPNTGKPVNGDTMHRWSRSASMPLGDMAEHLRQMAHVHLGDNVPQLSAAQIAAYQQIAAFEAGVAKRIEAGFAVVGPVLKASVEGADVDIDAVWDPLANLRNTLMKDVTDMRQKVRAYTGGQPLALSFPTYAPLPWEQGD